MRVLPLLAFVAFACRSTDSEAPKDSGAPVDDGACTPTDTPELCDGNDNDCDGEVDEGLGVTFWGDADADGFGDVGAPTEACEQPEGYANNADDCDDADPERFPNQIETCNGVDDDCDGTADEEAEGALTAWADADLDGYGDESAPISACEVPEGYVLDDTDCDDAAPTVNPAALEHCNGVDDDCDGEVDEDDAVDAALWYGDGDGDGWGEDSFLATACDPPAGFVDRGGDCHDADTAYNPGASEADCTDPHDYNCDGSTGYADADADGWAACAECDDSNAATNPAATEVCNGVDDDCDGATDEPDATDARAWYADGDADGYGDAASSTLACDSPAGHVADDTDCDDASAAVNPAAIESCNGIDDDCDGTVDEADAVDASVWYADTDGDGYGDPSATTTACSAPADTEADATDCDDTRRLTNPGATEYCNTGDDDCNGLIDDGATDALTFWLDADSDGYGDPSVSLTECTTPAGYVRDDDDCDDTDSSVNPGAAEVCNLVDDDCDGAVDDGATLTDWYADDDGDGYGDASTSTADCWAPSGYVADATDCDDTEGAVNPGEADVCDTLDNDCDGSKDNDGLCPCDVEEYGTHAYLFCATAQAWSDDRTDCQLYGYDLASVNDDAENTWMVDEAYSRYAGKWWIGYTDQYSEGTFAWINGDTSTYTNWHAGEPNGGVSESCTQLGRYADYSWNDEPCGSSFYFVCEE